MDETAIIYWYLTSGGRIDCLDDFDPKALWALPRERLESKALIQRRGEGIIREEIETLRERGIWLLSPFDAGYPSSLKNIHDPPPLLYGMGRLPSEDLPRIAVIGARKCSSYGLQAAKNLSEGLVKTGFVIVSGLALGIDVQAHKTAVDTILEEFGEHAPPATIAVLGSGIDICYPRDNLTEYRRIIKYGCILSEYPPGTKPLPHHFPRRNRIITGLSLGVIVAEAAAKSGTSRTVDLAAEQGREVFVVPGSMFSAYSEGANNFIKDGATTTTGYEDVLHALRRELGFRGQRAEDGGQSFKGAAEERLLKHITGEPRTAQMLAAVSGMAIQDVLLSLTRLEHMGGVRLMKDGYVKI